MILLYSFYVCTHKATCLSHVVQYVVKQSSRRTLVLVAAEDPTPFERSVKPLQGHVSKSEIRDIAYNSKSLCV